MRTSIEPTQSEITVFERFFKEQHPELDTTKNGQLFGEYLLVTWGVEVNETTLNTAWAQLKDQLEVLTPAKVRYDQVSRQDLKAATELYHWYVNQNYLVKDDQDKAFENQTALLLELRGREITTTNIQAAMGRVGHRNGLHYAPAPRRVDPRQHQDDGKGWMPRNETNLSARDHAARAHHARTETTPAPASQNENEPDPWRIVCEQLLHHGTHSCQENMRRVFEAKGEKSWRELHRKMDQVKKSYERLVRY